MPPRRWKQTNPGKMSASEAALDLTRRRESVVVESSDSEVFDISGQIKKKRKDKRIATLSEPEEEIMLKWLKEHPEFYNRRMMEYKNIPRKEALWKEKATEMGKSVEHLKTWYRSMRTRMARLIRSNARKPEDEFTDRDTWVIENLSFLRKHIEAVHRRPIKTKSIAHRAATTTSRGSLDPVITVKTEPASDFSEAPVSTTSASPVPRIPEVKRPGVQDRALVSTLEDLTDHIGTMQRHLINRLQPEGDPERLAFSEWMRATLVGLEHGVWRRTQREITDVLFRAVAENDAARHWPSQVPNATTVWGSTNQQQLQFQNTKFPRPGSAPQAPPRPSSAPPATSTSSSPDFSRDVSGFISNLLRNFDTRYNLQDTR
ncbi:PREDICTED: uncharacterized protein LOC109466196 [Branchiostoma belcheri]|uniref:Uncharacterized protein LOC109466196 n=1 Tax=Branchiostoma belcheri TaxID=7741 RepID=A0A6P4YB02_BRABE|nr:PREDICTED: uncharacterized protein LOC109466196 [Branchiostoma belcheri]XP_019619434.1 PREDICTED: uncharacterized protein LOC109466196 [Branchiostoma belcheri]